MRIISVVAVAVAGVGLCASAASAARSQQTVTQGNAFCAQAKAIATYLASTLQLTNGVAEGTPANLKLAYTTIASHEKGLDAAAPKSLKASLVGTFSFINLAKSDLAQVGWQGAKLVPFVPALVANGRKNQASIKAVQAYLNGTCHIPV